MFATANRDPRVVVRALGNTKSNAISRNRWVWGYGIHACVGRALAQLEAHVLLSEAARRVDRFELAGEMEPWMTTIGHGPAKLPLRIYAA